MFQLCNNYVVFMSQGIQGRLTACRPLFSSLSPATSRGARSGDELHRLKQQHEELCQQADSLCKRASEAVTIRQSYHRQREAMELSLTECETVIEATNERGGASVSDKLINTQVCFSYYLSL